MGFGARFVLILGLLSIPAIHCYGENPAAAPYSWKNHPKFNLGTQHKPLKGWRIEAASPGTARVYLNQKGIDAQRRGTQTSKNTALKGPDETLYYLLLPTWIGASKYTKIQCRYFQPILRLATLCHATRRSRR